MRVICIDDEDDENGFHDVHPSVGEICEVVTEGMGISRTGKRLLCYGLKGYPMDNAYNANNFSPLSNIDEKELLEERELQFQNA